MDAVLKEAGSCGRFQVFHVIFTQLPRFVMVWAVFLMMFGSYDPGWRCVKRYSPTNNTRMSQKDTNHPGEPITPNNVNFSNHSSSSEKYSRSLENQSSSGVKQRTDSNPFSPQQNHLHFNKSGVNVSKIDYDGKCDDINSCEEIEFNPLSITVLTRFQLVCERSWIVRCIFIIQGVGLFVGALIGGQIGERFGRRIGLYSNTFVVCVSSGIAILSPHWIMYAVSIFFLGLGANGVISLSSVYSMEFLNSKWRGYFGSFPTWNVSLLIFTLTTAAIKSWIYLHLITFILAFISCVGFFVVAESPRWLLMNGRPEKAEDAVRKIARINGKPPPNFDRLLQLQSDQKEPEEETKRKTYTYLDLFRTYDTRITALKLSSLMGLFGITYYALGFGTQALPGNFYVNAIASSACEIVNLLLAGPLCNRVGRRGAGVFMALLGTISCSSIVISLFAAEGTTQATIIKIFAFQAKGASQAIFSISQLFIVELFPTVVRNVGIGFCRCAAGLGTLVAPFLIPSASDKVSFAVCFSVLCLIYAVNVVIFLSLPETNKLDLKDGLDQQLTVATTPAGDNVENGTVEHG